MSQIQMYTLEPTPMEVCRSLAKKHKQMRKKQGMSQKEMSERSGVSLGSLKRFENTGKISLEGLLKLAHVSGRLHDFDSVFQPLEDLKEVRKLFTNS